MKRYLLLGLLFICPWFLNGQELLPVATTVVTAAPDQTTEGSTDTPASVLQITPTANYLNIEPGGHYEGYVDVINGGSKEFDFIVYAKPYMVSNESYDPMFEGESSQTMLSSWVSIASPSGTLASREVQRIKYTIDVPQDIPDGGQYAAIFVETGGGGEVTSTSIITRQRVGQLLFAEIDGETRLEGEVIEQTMSGFWWRPPIITQSLIENTGNTHFIAKYQLLKRGLFSSKSAARIVPNGEKQYTILPGTRRRVNLDWSENAPAAGLFWLTQRIEYLDQTAEKTKLVLVLHPVMLVCVAGTVMLGGTIYAMWLWSPNKGEKKSGSKKTKK